MQGSFLFVRWMDGCVIRSNMSVDSKCSISILEVDIDWRKDDGGNLIAMTCMSSNLFVCPLACQNMFTVFSSCRAFASRLCDSSLTLCPLLCNQNDVHPVQQYQPATNGLSSGLSGYIFYGKAIEDHKRIMGMYCFLLNAYHWKSIRWWRKNSPCEPYPGNSHEAKGGK